MASFLWYCSVNYRNCLFRLRHFRFIFRWYCDAVNWRVDSSWTTARTPQHSDHLGISFVDRVSACALEATPKDAVSRKWRRYRSWICRPSLSTRCWYHTRQAGQLYLFWHRLGDCKWHPYLQGDKSQSRARRCWAIKGYANRKFVKYKIQVYDWGLLTILLLGQQMTSLLDLFLAIT